MRYGRYGLSYVVLRLGLGLTFLWIGVDILRHPETWIGFLPASVPFGMTRETMLSVNGFFDMTLGLLLLLRVGVKWVGWLAVVHIAGIIAVHGIDPVIIRDVGLLGAALSLAMWPTRYHRKKYWWNRFSRSSGGAEDD